MNEEEFRQNYERMSDDELANVLLDRQNLVPEAAVALDSVAQQRNVTVPESTVWKRQAGSTERVYCLEDYEDYVQLVEKSRFGRKYMYPIALGPFALGLILARRALENSIIFIVVTVGWAMCVAVYFLVTYSRKFAFKCPQCSSVFGRGTECNTCGFPRIAS
ncbi:MAG TPA: hypothetical protein VMV39_08360 [Terracidiphilus sp.]|nr:hypothetical protein [Terracidiphilus sp.]